MNLLQYCPHTQCVASRHVLAVYVEMERITTAALETIGRFIAPPKLMWSMKAVVMIAVESARFLITLGGEC